MIKLPEDHDDNSAHDGESNILFRSYFSNIFHRFLFLSLSVTISLLSLLILFIKPIKGGAFWVILYPLCCCF